MILCDEIDVPINSRNAEYYESLGYVIPHIKSSKGDYLVVPKGTKICVQIKDLSLGSNIMIPCQCDYCGSGFQRRYISIVRSHKDGLMTDACGSKECSEKRRKDSLFNKYGSSNWVDIHEKTNTHLGRYLKYDLQYYIDEFAKLSRTICVDLIQNKDDIRTTDNLPFICNNHPDIGVQYSSYANIQSGERHCCYYGSIESRADKTRVADIELAKIICQERDYTLLTDNINTVDDKIEYICNKHENYGIQTTTLYGMTHYSCNCRLCSAMKSNGENHWNWQGGINDVNDSIRKSWKYKEWRNAVYQRDGFKCRKCGDNGILNAHHILNFSTYEDLRFDIDNGITLCKDCHREFHKMYGLRNNTRKQLDEFLQGG